MTIQEILTLLSGGGGGVVIIYVVKTLYQAFQDRWHNKLATKNVDIVERTASMSDAATANTLLLATIDAMHKENARLTTREQNLQGVIDQKDQRISELQGEIANLQKTLSRINDQLEELKSSS